jgi:ABC-type molybdate transport system ATPase subunit
VPIIYVTHDREDVERIADKVIVLENGSVKSG